MCENSKNELRKKMRTIRNNIADKEQKDLRIFDKVTDFVEKFFAKSIFTYVSMPSEVDTRRIISYYISDPNYEIYVPQTFDRKMTVHRLLRVDELLTDKYGNIPKTQIDKKPYSENINIAFVPLLAFDKNFHRLGYGAGYYDRFLAENNIYSVGLAYDEVEVNELPNEQHDIPLNVIITPRRIILNKK